MRNALTVYSYTMSAPVTVPEFDSYMSDIASYTSITSLTFLWKDEEGAVHV